MSKICGLCQKSADYAENIVKKRPFSKIYETIKGKRGSGV